MSKEESGTRSLVIPRVSKLKNVLLVEGLIVNLISVSQLRDEELLAQFTKDRCKVRNQSHCHIMEEERSSNIFYLLTNTNPYMNEISKNKGHGANNLDTPTIENLKTPSLDKQFGIW